MKIPMGGCYVEKWALLLTAWPVQNDNYNNNS